MTGMPALDKKKIPKKILEIDKKYPEIYKTPKKKKIPQTLDLHPKKILLASPSDSLANTPPGIPCVGLCGYKLELLINFGLMGPGRTRESNTTSEDLWDSPDESSDMKYLTVPPTFDVDS